MVLKQAAEVAALPWNEWQLSRGMGGRLRLESVAAHQRSVKALQEALLKSLEWNEAVLTGQVDSFEALIRRDNLNPRQTHRLRKLALLAPDIMEAIIAGLIPETLSLERLKSDFTSAWDARRKHFGFR